MKLRCFALAFVSFKKNLNRYFTLKFIIKGFEIAILISIFIFLAILKSKILANFGCFLAIFGLFLLLKSRREIWAWAGFFVGILWFYWISFSLVYYDFAWLIPLEILGIGTIYGLIFLVGGFFENLLIRAAFIAILGYFYPFNFNWLNYELIFVDTLFRPQIWTLILVLIGLILTIKFSKFGFLGLIFGLILSLNFGKNEPNFLPFSVELTNTNISQNLKWLNDNRSQIISQNFALIDKAISEKKELIILPETAFPVILNRQPQIAKILAQKSKQIAIITGAIAIENDKIFNSTFLFNGGKISRFDKAILVPFGEEIPLPIFAKKIINNLFFDGKNDFASAKNISNYEIKGQNITNAICYEATRPEIYKNRPKFVIAITNNAWFKPSTEPILQEILMKYFAYKYKTTIYHAVNGSPSKIITY